jgi:hypothetical protein
MSGGKTALSIPEQARGNAEECANHSAKSVSKAGSSKYQGPLYSDLRIPEQV